MSVITSTDQPNAVKEAQLLPVSLCMSGAKAATIVGALWSELRGHLLMAPCLRDGHGEQDVGLVGGLGYLDYFIYNK